MSSAWSQGRESLNQSSSHAYLSWNFFAGWAVACARRPGRQARAARESRLHETASLHVPSLLSVAPHAPTSRGSSRVPPSSWNGPSRRRPASPPRGRSLRRLEHAGRGGEAVRGDSVRGDHRGLAAAGHADPGPRIEDVGVPHAVLLDPLLAVAGGRHRGPLPGRAARLGRRRRWLVDATDTTAQPSSPGGASPATTSPPTATSALGTLLAPQHADHLVAREALRDGAQVDLHAGPLEAHRPRVRDRGASCRCPRARSASARRAGVRPVADAQGPAPQTDHRPDRHVERPARAAPQSSRPCTSSANSSRPTGTAGPPAARAAAKPRSSRGSR